MKKTRYIPFGYTVRNGRVVIDTNEADIIKNIFNQYINGASMNEIASSLTEKRIPYSEKTCEWGKAKIARIIENTKYIGSGEYDPIIDEDMFQMADECKKSRRTRDIETESKAIEIIRPHMKCELCGHPMVRSIKNECRIREAWTCQNPECKTTVRISDDDLLNKLTILINRIIENSTLLLPHSFSKGGENTTMKKLKEEIEAESMSENPSDTLILEKVASIAAEEYKNNNAMSMITARVAQKRVEMMDKQIKFNTDYFSDIIDTIYLGTDGKIKVKTKTNTEIKYTEEE